MELKSILRGTLFTALFLVPFIPFVVADGFFFPFITGKNFVFRVLVEIALAAWLLLALKDPAMRPRLPGQKGWLILPAAFLLFLVTMGISTVLAENPVKAFWSNFERMEGYIGLLHSTAYVFVLWLSMNSEKLWSRFWNASVAASFLMGCFGILQLGGVFPINQGGVRVDGTFGNATYLAVYMLFHVFISLWLMVKSWNTTKYLRYVYPIAIAVQLTMIYFSATRGSILGVLGGLFLAGLLMLFTAKDNGSLKKWGIGAVVAIVIIAGAFFAAKDTEFVKNNEVLTRIASISLADGQTRFAVWGMALKGFMERPVFGWGQEGFNYLFNEHYQPSLYAQEPWFDRAHDAYLDWLVAGGAPAFLIYVSFYLIALWYLWRKGSDFTAFERSAFTGLLAAYAFHNLFVFDNLISYVFFMSVLAYILFRREGARESVGKPIGAGAFPGVAAAAGVLLACVIYFANVPGMLAASNIIQGITQHQSITENFDYFKKAAAHSGLGEQEVREQLLQFAVQVRQLAAGDAAFQGEVASFAASEMQKEIEKVPNDARLQLFLGSYLRQMGDTDNARAYLIKAHELSPKKQQILFELAILETNLGKYADALEWFRQAFELDPAFADARVFYAVTALRAGQSELAYKLLEEGFGTRTPDNDYVLQAYNELKDYPKMIAVAELRVKNDPGNAQKRVQLAAAYLTVNRRADAVKELTQAITLDPSFAEQGQYYINEIQAGRNP